MKEDKQRIHEKIAEMQAEIKIMESGIIDNSYCVNASGTLHSPNTNTMRNTNTTNTIRNTNGLKKACADTDLTGTQVQDALSTQAFAISELGILVNQLTEILEWTIPPQPTQAGDKGSAMDKASPVTSVLTTTIDFNTRKIYSLAAKVRSLVTETELGRNIEITDSCVEEKVW